MSQGQVLSSFVKFEDFFFIIWEIFVLFEDFFVYFCEKLWGRVSIIWRGGG
jgi:hypothetical protein